MIIGIPKEIKPQENRIAATPTGVMSFISAGHDVYIETNAGIGSGFPDEQYISAGAKILGTKAEVYEKADMIYKVKEPLEPEYKLLRENQVIFTFLHLAPDIPQANALLESGITSIAYECVRAKDGSLPLLAPMSEIAGKLATQVGASLLQKINGGSGVLLGGLPGVLPGHVVIIGGGVAGTGAARIACGFGARVTILDSSLPRMAELQDIFQSRVSTLMSSHGAIAQAVAEADLLIGAVLIPGTKAPRLVSEDMVKSMAPGSVIVDISIDQGGIVETADHKTSHKDPTFVKHGVLHYTVPNMPGAVPRTSTFALSNATLPFALELANKGAEKAMRENPSLRSGLSTYKGKLIDPDVAASQNRECEKVSF